MNLRDRGEEIKNTRRLIDMKDEKRDRYIENDYEVSSLTMQGDQTINRNEVTRGDDRKEKNVLNRS